ncbi:MAG: SDR family oxidoreductase [Defluviitaleaceae bacterium]|nr:SDR family oxidoreductase [Defluviitaleaceae bacterium]
MTNKYALITDTTSGIGRALSEKFAQEGINLILVSRDLQKLSKQADFLSTKYAIEIHAIVADLKQENAAHMIYKKTKEIGINIQYLINNAGFNERGTFLETSLSNEIDMIKVHVIHTTEMMKFFIPNMVKNGYGRVLNLGSTASFMPCPNSSVYGATKAYVLYVSKGISEELKKTGVTVTALCPGATNTAFAHKAKMEHTLLFRAFVMKPESVASIGYRAMMRGKSRVVAGTYNKLLVMSTMLLPEFITNPITKAMLR